ncbi:GntR family transcriptional regulator [Actinomadura rudentiformis]|uniref:GntR family transcriptional regulator n=1 Tax=Actinomadura rudentiformis TaxID=359158 RepID=A0A6H9Z2Y7_9ACTN|nr:GntR family transcriptional regulator [Actinomadura rudentiformis]KAB2350083.1 GntR family transcriptional regulator [Actinomadura rudentiformis]
MATTHPLYERIEKRLRARLDAAADGDLLPSEPQLAKEFGVARMTVRAALAGLERVPGKGTFVRKAAPARPVGTLLSFHDETLAAGRTPSSRVLYAARRAASPEERANLYPAGAPQDVIAISRVRLADGLPVALEHAAFPADLDTLLTADLEVDSLHATLRRLGRNPTLGSSVLTARTADDDAAELGVSPTTPLLVETRSILDQHGDPLEYTISCYVADRYALKVDFTVAAPAPTG